VTVKLEFESKGTPKGRLYNDGAEVRLLVNDRPAGKGEIPKAGNRHGVEPFEVGRDSISPVSRDYQSKGSFPFMGRIEKITFEVTPTR
jgi:arylsulfatase